MEFKGIGCKGIFVFIFQITICTIYSVTMYSMQFFLPKLLRSAQTTPPVLCVAIILSTLSIIILSLSAFTQICPKTITKSGHTDNAFIIYCNNLLYK